MSEKRNTEPPRHGGNSSVITEVIHSDVEEVNPHENLPSSSENVSFAQAGIAVITRCMLSRTLVHL
jgi:hypothetical protein